MAFLSSPKENPLSDIYAKCLAASEDTPLGRINGILSLAGGRALANRQDLECLFISRLDDASKKWQAFKIFVFDRMYPASHPMAGSPQGAWVYNISPGRHSHEAYVAPWMFYPLVVSKSIEGENIVHVDAGWFVGLPPGWSVEAVQKTKSSSTQ